MDSLFKMMMRMPLATNAAMMGDGLLDADFELFEDEGFFPPEARGPSALIEESLITPLPMKPTPTLH
ncbi:MAG: hypothetical protein MRY63_05980 [Neomegalonema sp.]|nr:hypothetical protein [Neomegalonema sp.]